MEEERLSLGGGEPEDLCGRMNITFSSRHICIFYLAVSADEKAALARVDPVAGERVDLDLLYS